VNIALPEPPRLVVLDREGVLLHHVDPYIVRREQVRIIDGAAAAVARIALAGIAVAVATNQSCINRGLVPAAFVTATCEHVRAEVRALGGDIARFYICPHRPDQGCACRKPAPRLLRQAMRDSGAEPGQTWVIGDHDTDVLAGRRARCGYCVHVLSGRQSHPSPLADACFADLASAVAALLPATPGYTSVIR
jgi:D-glycero-D-manno-heptose 1,7-bisphosphate phosphatase